MDLNDFDLDTMRPSMAVKNPGVSVLVCCYNSKDRIPETVRHLARQEVIDTLNWEIILIDNASTDNTSEVAREVWKNYRCAAPLVILYQPIPGKTAALKTGYEAAKYDYVLICDDDNWLNADYVQRAYNLMHKDESLGALGGKGIPACEQIPPAWFYDRYSLCYAVGPQLINEAPLEKRYLYGAGMVIRRDVLEMISRSGLEYILSCRKGDGKRIIVGGGDTEICFVLSLMGYKIIYDESLQFRHYISGNRLSHDYLKRLYKGYGVTLPLLSTYEELLKCKSQEISVNKLFWVRNFFRYFRDMMVNLFLLGISIVYRRNILYSKMDFIFNGGIAYHYLKYNFFLSRKIVALNNVFGVKKYK